MSRFFCSIERDDVADAIRMHFAVLIGGICMGSIWLMKEVYWKLNNESRDSICVVKKLCWR